VKNLLKKKHKKPSDEKIREAIKRHASRIKEQYLKYGVILTHEACIKMACEDHMAVARKQGWER
jgi:hypothetical protein